MPAVKPTRLYRGVVIIYTSGPGYRLRWTALGRDGVLAADTLAGIKRLIRAEQSA